MNTKSLATRDRGAMPCRSFLAPIGQMIMRAWKAWLVHRTERALHGLSDYQLKDIGLHRSEIGSVVRDMRAGRSGRPPRSGAYEPSSTLVKGEAPCSR